MLDETKSNRVSYFRANVTLIAILLVIWAIVSFGCGILLAPWLNQVKLPGTEYPLGFWFAQQGSIYVFVVLIFVYAQRMNALDKEFGVEEDDLIAAVLDAFGLRDQAGGVIAARFGGTGAARRGAGIVAADPDLHRFGTALEVWADRRGDQDVLVLPRRTHAEEDLAGEHEGAQIQRGPFALRDPVGIGGDNGRVFIGVITVIGREHPIAIGIVGDCQQKRVGIVTIVGS